MTKKTADTILKRAKEIKMGNRTIKCKPITLATFVAVSEIISWFPHPLEELQKTDSEILSFVLTEAKGYSGVSDLIAVLALGQPRNDTFIQRWKRARLSNYIADKVPVTELGNIINQLLDSVSVSHFFQCTTSLSELNVLKGKRKNIQYGGR